MGATDATVPATRGNPHPEWRERFLEALREAPQITLAAKKAGVHRATVYRHKADDPEFARAMYEARMVGVEMMEDVAINRSLVGWEEDVYHQGVVVGKKRVFDNKLLLAMLGRFKPGEYRPAQRHEHTGKDGGAIEVTTIAQIKERAKRARLAREAKFKLVESKALSEEAEELPADATQIVTPTVVEPDPDPFEDDDGVVPEVEPDDD